MTPVVVERWYQRPVTLDALATFDAEGQWCISANGGSAILHALSSNGLRSLCLYEAPDAEAMRRVADVLGGNLPTMIWATTEHWSPRNAPRPDLDSRNGQRVIALVERRFEAPTDYWAAETEQAGADLCLAIHDVAFLRSYLSLDRKRMLCLYRAPDIEAVRAAGRLTSLPVTEIMPVMVRQTGRAR